MIRNYILGQSESVNFLSIGTADSSHRYILIDQVHTCGFNNLSLYLDSGGASPIPNSSYEMSTVDVQWTEDEAQPGGSGGTIYSQFRVTDATYHGVPLFASFTNFGTYTDNDAPYVMVGGSISVASTQTVSLPIGNICTTFEADTSLSDITLTIPDPDFAGQEFMVTPVDDGICYVRGSGTIDADGYKSGIYDGGANTGLYVTKNHRVHGKAVEKGGVLVWQVTVEETADYSTGAFGIKVFSNGNAEQVYTSGVNTTGTPIGSIFATTTLSVVFPIPFSSAPEVLYGAESTAGICWSGTESLPTTTTHNVRLLSYLVSATGSVIATYKEKF